MRFTRIKNLTNGVENVTRRLEKASQDKGEDLAQQLLNGSGRGLWVLILWPACIFIFLEFSHIISMFLSVVLKNNDELFLLLISLSGAAIITTTWYKSYFTRQHPFIGLVLMVFVPLPVAEWFFK